MAAERRAPEWPLWTVPAVLVLGWVAGSIAAVLLVVPFAAAGEGGDLTPATSLAASLGLAAGALGAIALIASRTAPLRAGDLGLRGAPLIASAAWAALALAVLGAFAWFWSQAADLSQAFGVPEELGETTPLGRALGGGPDTGRVDLSGGVAASALARVVVPAVTAEILLRGFALPVLARRWSPWAALPVASLLTAAPLAYAAGGGESPGALLPVGAALGLALCWLYLETASLRPGVVVSALALGWAFAQALEWGAGEAALLAAGCAIAALALVVALGRALGSDAAEAT